MIDVLTIEFDLKPSEKRNHYFAKPFELPPNFCIVGVALIRYSDKFRFEIENALEEEQKITVYVSEMPFTKFVFEKENA